MLQDLYIFIFGEIGAVFAGFVTVLAVMFALAAGFVQLMADRR